MGCLIMPPTPGKGPRPFAGLLGSARRALRMAGAAGRSLPHFVIVGAQKAGTTSLYSYLLQHPQVLPAERKEVHFFDLNWERGERWYRSHLPTKGEMERASSPGRPAVTGEASPYYLFHPHAPARLARLLPEAKIIVMLRDPVARAYSHYRHNVRKGEERLPFEEALDRECEIMDAEIERMIADPRYRSPAHQLYSYLARGRYAEQLERWFACFAREQVLILRSEDFFEDPQPVYSEVLRFLGLDQWRVDAGRAYNIGRYDPDLIPGRDQLTSHFRPFSAQLHRLVGRDIDWL